MRTLTDGTAPSADAEKSKIKVKHPVLNTNSLVLGNYITLGLFNHNSRKAKEVFLSIS